MPMSRAAMQKQLQSGKGRKDADAKYDADRKESMKKAEAAKWASGWGDMQHLKPRADELQSEVLPERKKAKGTGGRSGYNCGGSVKKHSKGGSVRGAGKAQKGVRKCKMR